MLCLTCIHIYTYIFLCLCWCRVKHHQIDTELSPSDFRKHYRMDRQSFEYILGRIRRKLQKKSSMARNAGRTDAAMTPEQMLGSLLKHLGGSTQHDINHHYRFHRTTVQKSLYRTMRIIVEEFPLGDFPFKNQQKLRQIAKEWECVQKRGWSVRELCRCFRRIPTTHIEVLCQREKSLHPAKILLSKGFLCHQLSSVL